MICNDPLRCLPTMTPTLVPLPVLYLPPRMSQIPRRTTLSMTQPPKVRKTPSVSPAFKRQESDSPRTTPKTIDVDTPIVIEDSDFGDSRENQDLIQVLSSVEEKNGQSPQPPPPALSSQKPMAEAEKVVKVHEAPPVTPTNGSTGGKAKEIASSSPSSSKRSGSAKSKKGSASATASEGQESTGDDQLSSSTSVRSSVDSTATRGETENLLEMDSILLAEDDELVSGAGAVKEKSVSSTDSPRPRGTPGSGTKVVRLTKGMRLSPFRKATDPQPLDNVSTIVNLSTVSEQSVENNLDSPSAVTSAAKNGGAEDGLVEAAAEEGSATDTAAGRSSSRITARRTYATNRPLREMSFRNATREAYRKNGNGSTEENSNEAAANDSVNATVGSELGFNLDDLPETPAGQKRRRDSSDAEDETAPEAKKSLFQTYCAIM